MFRALLLIALFYFIPSTKLQAADGQLKIGVISALSGAAAKWSHFQNLGMKLAIEELSLNSSTELIFEDSQTDPKKAILAMNRLVKNEKVDLVIFNDFGFVMAPLLPLFEKAKIPLIALGPPEDRYCLEAPNYFLSIGSRLARSKDSIDNYFSRNPNIKKIAILAFDDPDWGASYTKMWEDSASTHEVQVIDKVLNNEWQPDFKSIITRIIQRNPDAIFVAHEPEGFMKTVRQLGFRGSILAANNFLEMLFEAPNGRPELSGVFMVDPKLDAGFIDRFTRRYNSAPILEAYTGFEAIRVVDSARRSHKTPLIQALKSVKYDGISGTIDLTHKNCAANVTNWGLFQFNTRGIPETIN